MAMTDEEKKRRGVYGDAAAATSNPGLIPYAPNYGAAGLVPRAPAAASAAAPSAAPAQMGTNLAGVRQASADEVRSLSAQGNTAQAIGASVRGDLASIPAFAADVGNAIAKDAAPVIGGISRFASGLFGGEAPAAPATAANTPTGSVTNRTPPAQAAGLPGYQNSQSPSNMPTSAAGSSNLAGLESFRTGGGDITKTVDANGRTSYSGTNIGAGATINGQQPGGGYTEVPGIGRGLAGFQAPQSAQPGLATAPTIRHSGNDWQARNDLRNAQIAATSLTNQSAWADPNAAKANVAAYQSALDTDAKLRQSQPGMNQEAMRINAGYGIEGIRQAGQNQREGARLGLEAFRAQDARATNALERQRTGLAMEGEQQIAGLRQTLLSAESTPEQKKQAQASLLALQGKQEQANRFTVVPGGQHIDQASGRAYTVPSQVLNNQTGQWMQAPGQTQTAQAGPQDRPVGTTSTVNGKTATWDGNKWVPT